MASSHDSTLAPASHGPVTRAVAALRADHPDDPATRRGFLRALAALPMIGGGVALIGAPEAVAEPITRDLLVTYADWLLMERRRLLKTLYPDPAERVFARRSVIGSEAADAFHIPFDGRGGSPDPTTRAALVLSAVGCDWRG